MAEVEFLVDENVLGIARYLENKVKYRKIGDQNALPKGSSDPVVAKFAKDHNLIIVTKDDKLIEECKLSGIKYITINDIVLAKEVLTYPNSD